jgi:hypothetical protein
MVGIMTIFPDSLQFVECVVDYRKKLWHKTLVRRILIKISRAIFGWPPRPASLQEKYSLVARFGQQRQIDNFIETGTFEGDMVEAQRGIFHKIVTIELGDKLFEVAKQRFSAYDHIHVLHGDSGTMLVEAMHLIDGPVVYWLDAHYSKGITAHGEKETPILKELSLIAARGQYGDVILIDDARLFGLNPAYPKLATIQKFVARHLPTYSFKVESDMICIIPS